MQATQASDRGEAEGLYDRIAPAVYSLGLADTRSRTEAEDLVQQTLLAYLEARGRGILISNPEAWALRAAANALKRRGRGRRLWSLLERPPELAATDDVATQVAASQAPAVRALQRLGRDDRVVITLYRLAGHSDTAVARIVGTAPASVRQRLVRAKRRLCRLYLEELLGRRPAARGCASFWSLLPRSAAGGLGDLQAERLHAHLAGCADCRQARTELDRYWREGLTGLLALRPPAAARAPAVARLLGGVSRQPPPAARPARSKSGWRPALWLLLPLLLLLPGLPPAAAGASPVSLDASRPCPVPAPAAGYAYLDAGDLYYRARLGAPPRRLTWSGGRVDAFWWSPDGTRIAYKQQASPPDVSGVVRVISIRGGDQPWALGSAVDSFAFSPDGSRFVAASRVLRQGAWTGESVTVGDFADPDRPAREWLLPLPGSRYDPADFEDTPELPQAVANPLLGVFWTGPLLDFNLPQLYWSLDPATGAISAPRPDTPSLENRWLGIPGQSRFAINWYTGDLQRTCAGRAIAETRAALAGRAELLSVTADGEDALLSLNEGAAAVAWLQPDGTLGRLSSDGRTTGARWRP